MTAPTTLNPYHVAGPIHDPAFFFGRSDQLRRILESAWQHHQSINVVGEARSGKTSLLFRMLDNKLRATFVPEDVHSIYVYLNPELCPDAATFFRLVLEGVEKEYPGLLHFGSSDPVSASDLEAYLHALLPHHLVLLVDNFERMCEAPHFTSDFFDYLKGLAEHTEAYITMVIASRKHIHELCPSDSLGSDFFGVFGEVRLGGFTADEFDEFIRVTSSGRAPVHEVQETIRKLAGYYPYLAQMACSHAYDLWRRKGRLQQEDMATVRRKFQHDARVHFEKTWTRHLSASERQVLSLLARGKDLQADTILQDADSQDITIEAVLDDLEAKGYLANARIASQCFADFILTQLDTSRAVNSVAMGPQPREQGIRIDQASGGIYIDGARLQKQSSPLQYRLLLHLWQHKGAVCKKDDLAVVGWDTAEGVTDEALAQQIARLRALLGDGRRYILTVNRWGYKMVDNPDQPDSDSRKGEEPAGSSHTQVA